MKIICIEEHVVDGALARATQPLQAEHVPYMQALGSRYRDEPSAAAADRPALEAPQQALALGSRPIDDRLRTMTDNGIDMQVLSYTHPIQALPPDVAIPLARAANDRLHEASRRHPDRFAGFSTLPWQQPDAAVRELDRTVNELGLTATMLAGHPGENVLVDDPRFEPILARLEQLRVPLYIHPGPPLPAVQGVYYGGLDAEVSARLSLYGWGWHHEAGIQVVRLILSGALDRHPDLEIVSGHWGEMVPFFLQRMDDTMPRGATGLSRTIGQTYRDQVYVTPSGMLNLPHFRFVHEVLGFERIVFAIDYPYLTMTGARAWLEALPIQLDEKEAIAHGNAERLLRLAAA